MVAPAHLGTKLGAAKGGAKRKIEDARTARARELIEKWARDDMKAYELNGKTIWQQIEDRLGLAQFYDSNGNAGEVQRSPGEFLAHLENLRATTNNETNQQQQEKQEEQKEEQQEEQQEEQDGLTNEEVVNEVVDEAALADCYVNCFNFILQKLDRKKLDLFIVRRLGQGESFNLMKDEETVKWFNLIREDPTNEKILMVAVFQSDKETIGSFDLLKTSFSEYEKILEDKLDRMNCLGSTALTL